MLNFKEMQSNDLTIVKEIYDWYVAHSTATFHTEPVTPEELSEFIYISHPVYKSYLIYSDDQVAGYCYFTYYKKRQAYNRTAEVTLYLRQEACHKGIGKQTMAFMEEQAKACGLKNLLGIISGDNEGSIALFEHAGYFKCAHFKHVGEKFGKILDVVAYQKEI